MATDKDLRIADLILDLTQKRGAGKTICPSDVARRMQPDWRVLMPDVRRVAADLSDQGHIVATQRGAAVDIRTVRGPIRLGVSQQTA